MFLKYDCKEQYFDYSKFLDSQKWTLAYTCLESSIR